MRFVFVSTMIHYPWGGSEELWSRAALRLRQEGHHVAAAVTWWPQMPKPIAHLQENGVEIFVRPPPFTRFTTRAWRRLQQKLGWKPLGGQDRWLVEQKPDLVCVSNGGNMDGLPALEACLQAKLPYVTVIQANAEFLWPSDGHAESIIPVYQNARRAFFVSQQNRRLFETQIGMPLANAEVVRNPFNVRWEAAPPWPDEAQGWKLACVARYEPNAKGQDLLMQVLATDRWKSRPVTLSLFGSGPVERGLRRLATTLGLDGRVQVCGQSADIEKVWTTHHALALVSRYEGLPLVLVESMLCSRPAIITEVAGDGEMVEEDVSGFIAEAPTVGFVAAALERAWERRADWRAIGQAARQRAEKLVDRDPIGIFCARLKACLR
jgi:glycosyltransferase involved in cell wall biosynthesis